MSKPYNKKFNGTKFQSTLHNPSSLEQTDAVLNTDENSELLPTKFETEIQPVEFKIEILPNSGPETLPNTNVSNDIEKAEAERRRRRLLGYN